MSAGPLTMKSKEAVFKGPLTKRSVLERKGDDALDTLVWQVVRLAWKSFRDDNPDAPQLITCIPVVLSKELLVEFWERHQFKLAIPVNAQRRLDYDWPWPISSEKAVASLLAIDEDGGLKDNLVGMSAVFF